MQTDPIDLNAALATFSDHWHPRIVTNFNDYDVRIVKVLGEYVWHKHDDTDELFLVISGELTIDIRGEDPTAERSVILPRGSVYVVPRGVQHRPRANAETSLLLLDPVGTPTTGDYAGAIPEHITSTTGMALG